MPARLIYLAKRVETEVTTRMMKILGVYQVTPAQFIILSFVENNKSDLSSASFPDAFQ